MMHCLSNCADKRRKYGFFNTIRKSLIRNLAYTLLLGAGLVSHNAYAFDLNYDGMGTLSGDYGGYNYNSNDRSYSDSELQEMHKQQQKEITRQKLMILIKETIAAYDNLALAYIHKGDKKEAADVHYSLGKFFDRIEWNNTAIMEVKKGVGIDPAPSVDTYNLLGKLYGEIEDYEQSTKTFKKALEINPDYAPTYNNLGLVYVKQGLQEEAKKEFERSIEIQPNFIDAHQNLAVYYYEKEDYESALKEWVAISEIDPEYSNLKKNMDLVKEKMQVND